MCEIVDRIEHLRAPLRLEQGIEPRRSLFVDAILVRIEKIGVGIFSDRLRHLEKCERCKLVIMIEKGDVIAFGNFEGRIRIAGNAFVFRKPYQAEPLVLSCEVFQQVPVVAVRVGIGNAGFPMPIGLSLQ